RPWARRTSPWPASRCTCTAEESLDPCGGAVCPDTPHDHREQARARGVSDTMAFSVQMPALGESVTEGTVTRWLKQEGESVEVDEPLLEVSTDKVDTEIPSPAAAPRRAPHAQPAPRPAPKPPARPPARPRAAGRPRAGTRRAGTGTGRR